MLAVNQVLQQGRYRIIDEFGQNGIGAGYEAYDTVLKTNVLLKENWVNLGKVTTAAQMETLKVAFVNEAKILTELKHESLLEIQNYFAEIDRQYLVTEYADGDYLSELLEKNKSPFPLAKAVRLADQLLDVLTYLHTRVPPIIHRGIRPQDIKLTSGEKVKLLIFGIAKNFGTKTNNDFKNQTFDTANMNYLPLEQIWEGLDAASQKVVLNSYDEESQKILELPADPRSDIYSLGATLYHLLTARRPIDALERSIEIMEGKNDPLPSPSEINSKIPTEISAVLMKALEIKREDRFSSAEVMRHILQSELSRVKEREEARSIESEDDDMLEIGFATMQKTFEPKPLRVEPEDSKAEAEKMRQMELMKQRLHEAEAQRLLAEERAAEAEKRLLEREAEQITKKEPVVETPNSVSITTLLDENKNENKASPVKFEKLDEVKEHDEFKDLFAEPQKENKSMRRMAVAAMILVILGGTAWGVWTFMPAKQADTNQAVSFEEKNKPAPSVETVIAPTPEANQIPVESSPETVETAVSTSAVKNKTAQPSPPQTKKTAATPAKTPAQKKPVTVDDLINDN